MADINGPQSVGDKLKYSTVRLVCEYLDGKSGLGTGFVVQFELDGGRMLLCLVTNIHVVKNLKSGYAVFHHGEIKDGKVQPTQEFLKAGFNEHDWVPHPENEIDLCALPINGFLQEWHDRGKPVYAPAISEDLFGVPKKLDMLQDLEEILMVGYPIGLWDAINNFPLFRRGITATSPRHDYNGKTLFLIDAACFPGSSGSPVFIYNQGAYATKHGVVIGSRIIFLGVLFAGPQHNVEGNITVVNIPTVAVPIATSLIPANLGYVIKAIRVLELKEAFRKKFGL